MHFKKSVCFWVGFQMFLKHPVLEIKSNFGIKDSRLLYLLFCFTESKYKRSQAVSADTKGFGGSVLGMTGVFGKAVS